jgi:hypothetical protein
MHPSNRAKHPASYAVGRLIGAGVRLAPGVFAALVLLSSNALAAQSPVRLGSVDSFAVLGGSFVTSVGPSSVNGDLGGTPASNETGTETAAALFTTLPGSVATTVGTFGTRRDVSGAFRVLITGVRIRRVVFSLGTSVIGRRSKAPFETSVGPSTGIQTLTAHVTFTDNTPTAALSMRFRAHTATSRPSDNGADIPQTQTAARGGVG